MSEGQSFISGQVVIVGGGVAGLEALIALRALLGARVAVTLVSHDDWFIDRPLMVAEPFGGDQQRAIPCRKSPPSSMRGSSARLSRMCPPRSTGSAARAG